jgi:hypothetical protein
MLGSRHHAPPPTTEGVLASRVPLQLEGKDARLGTWGVTPKRLMKNHSSILCTCRSVALAKPYLKILVTDDDGEVTGEITGEVCRLYECPRPCTNIDIRTATTEVTPAPKLLPKSLLATSLLGAYQGYSQQSFSEAPRGRHPRSLRVVIPHIHLCKMSHYKCL